MNKRKLVIMLTGLAIGVIGATYNVQAAPNKNVPKQESTVLLAHHNDGSSVINYVDNASNRKNALNEAVRIHGTTKNNCTFYLASILRGTGINVPTSIGYTTNLGDWLGQNGWTRSTNMSNLKPGDVVFSGDTHTYIFLSWANKDKLIANVNDDQAVFCNNQLSYERNLHGANGNGYVPGHDSDNTYMRATYYMTPNNVSNNSSVVTPTHKTSATHTTIESSIGWLHFRTGNNTGYRILADIPTGTQVNVLGQSNGWYKVNYNNQIGWICGNYTTGIKSGSVTTSPQPTKKASTNQSTSKVESKTTIQSSIGWLHFRTGNSTSYNILGKIPTGTQVNVLGQSNGWYKVEYNGQIGWICGSYTTGLNNNSATSSVQTNAIGTTNIYSSIGWLHFRSGAGLNYNILDKIPTGTQVKVYSQSGNWYKVMYNGQTGWIYSTYTTGIN
ncbi:MAG: SH3 domain-containing protein [Sarcina sp.]